MNREQVVTAAAAAGCLGIVAAATIVEWRQRRPADVPCGCEEPVAQPSGAFGAVLDWLDETDHVRPDDYTPTERLIAGAISTMPPYSRSHPERALPVARVALGAVAANRDATATVVAARVADVLGPDALDDDEGPSDAPDAGGDDQRAAEAFREHAHETGGS